MIDERTMPRVTIAVLTASLLFGGCSGATEGDQESASASEPGNPGIGGKADDFDDDLEPVILEIVNTYTEDELEAIEGVSHGAAENIVAWREEHNAEFQTIASLRTTRYVGNDTIHALAREARTIDDDSDDTPTVLTLEAGNDTLPELGDERVWEGWIIVNGHPVSTGQFEASPDETTYEMPIDPDRAAAASKFVLTIEPTDEPAGTPSSQKYLAGKLEDRDATITTTAGPTISGANLSGADGDFFLAAPSGRNNSETDYKNGIWFIDNTFVDAEPVRNLYDVDGTEVTFRGYLADELKDLFDEMMEAEREQFDCSADSCTFSVDQESHVGDPPSYPDNAALEIWTGSQPSATQAIAFAVRDVFSRLNPDMESRFFPRRIQHGPFLCETSGTPAIYGNHGGNFSSAYCYILEHADQPTAGLELPPLGEGWTYEGWVVKDGMPVSTGRFDDPAAADSDDGGPFAGDAGTPPFPGQDFVTASERRDLTDGYKAVITVEPQPDDSPKPFAFKPLAGDIADAGPKALQSLKPGDLPTADVEIRAEISDNTDDTDGPTYSIDGKQVTLRGELRKELLDLFEEMSLEEQNEFTCTDTECSFTVEDEEDVEELTDASGKRFSIYSLRNESATTVLADTVTELSDDGRVGPFACEAHGCSNLYGEPGLCGGECVVHE